MRWLLVATSACAPRSAPEPAVPDRPEPADLAPRTELVETIHGVQVADPYRGLEDPGAPDVADWVARRGEVYRAHTDGLEQREWLFGRLQQLWRYDDETVRSACLVGDRQIFRSREADQDEWVVHLAEGPDDPGRVVVDPNAWPAEDELASFTPSPDCRYAVIGRARAGDEDPRLVVLDLDSGEWLDDAVRGVKQGRVAWKHDSSGFWYSSKPEGDFYHHRAWWHALGTSADQDELVLHSDEDKNLWHGISVSEDGRWQLRHQGLFNANRLWLLDLEAEDAEPVAVTTALDASYDAQVVDGRLIVHTDKDAPRGRVMVADVATPTEWTELVPESEDTLEAVSAIGGRLYLRYAHDVATRLVVYELDGTRVGEVPLPTHGVASVSGQWARPEVTVTFQSFAHPPAVYQLVDGALQVVKPSAMPVDPELLERIVVDRVHYTSPDGTQIPMWVVHDREVVGPVPTLLTGYGGFNISRRPSFDVSALLWIERGGAFALPNLRGGGEFGRAWHRAGMGANKQNVFDDFLTGATWLIEEGWTTPEQLAISGRSNGGLLVSAAVTQAPDRFGAVLVGVPLTDMVRFHRFGIADIWTEEYGSPDDPEAFPHLLAYSPYHAVRDGTDYPAILVVGSANDARTDPVHALKFAAAVRHADVDRGTLQPILLDVQEASGHKGGVTIDARADQLARTLGFLMSAVGL